MDVSTPDFIGPFQDDTKNCIVVLEKAARHFFPSTHYASLSQFCRLSFKHEFN